MIKDVFDDEDCLRIYAEDQRWDKETLKQLKEECNIFFMSGGDGISPVMLKDDNGQWYSDVSTDLCKWIEQDRLFHVKIQCQLHKFMGVM